MNQKEGSGMDTPPSGETITEGRQEGSEMEGTNGSVLQGDDDDDDDDNENRPKQLNYQHTKVYQDSDGRFVIQETSKEEQEEQASAETDQATEGTPDRVVDRDVEAGTEEKEQALRYLEAFASSVAEEMKKQAAQHTSAETNTEQSETIVAETADNAAMTENVGDVKAEGTTEMNYVTDYSQENRQIETLPEITREDGEDYERQDSTTDDAENPEEGDENIGIEGEQPDQLVTVVVTDETSQKDNTEATTNKLDDKNTLRRSKRKRRSKKRGYEDEDDTRKKVKEEERNANVKDEDEGDIDEKDFENEEPSSGVKIKNEVTSWTCKHCGKIFSTSTQYKQHLRTHSDQKPHQCIFCSKRFRQKCQKDKHERIHTGAKPYRCRHCDRAFSESGSRNRHERIHTGYKPYVCQHCDKCFIQKGNKDAHEKIHTTFKPYKCPNENCNDTFASEDEVIKHREGHPQKPYRCHYCCKGFPFNAERKRHERCHTGIKPYRCAFCEKTFTQKGNKDNHERTHTGDKPHCCTYCPKGFIRKQYLEKHMKKKHAKDMYQYTQPAVYAVLELDPNLQKDGQLAAESLLKAAHIVAQHQIALQNGGDVSANIEAEQLGQVMAEVSQQLSNVEHHVAIVEQDGIQHQVQVVEHHREVQQDEPITVLDGQIIEEHEVIGIQNQVVVGESEITISNEGQVVIQQQQITDEECQVSVVNHQLPEVETRLVSSDTHQILQQNSEEFAEENQEFTTVKGQVVQGQVVQGQFVHESIIVVRQDDLNNDESETEVVSRGQAEGHVVEQDDLQTEPTTTTREGNGFGSEVVQQEDGDVQLAVDFDEQDQHLVIHGHNIVIQTRHDT